MLSQYCVNLSADNKTTAFRLHLHHRLLCNAQFRYTRPKCAATKITTSKGLGLQYGVHVLVKKPPSPYLTLVARSERKRSDNHILSSSVSGSSSGTSLISRASSRPTLPKFGIATPESVSPF